jgi:tetratricopeptide (TPR) repeat protein
VTRTGLLAAASLAACIACEHKTAGVAAVVDAGPPPGVTPGVQLLREADAALQAGRLDEAIEKSTAALKLEPKHPLACNVLGRALLQRYEQKKQPEDLTAAKAAFQSALETNPDFWPALQNLGALAEAQGNLSEAASYYQRLLKAEPQHPEHERLEQLISLADAGR